LLDCANYMKFTVQVQSTKLHANCGAINLQPGAGILTVITVWTLTKGGDSGDYYLKAISYIQ